MNKKTGPTAQELLASLSNLEAQLLEASLTSTRRRALETDLHAALSSVAQLLDRLDPISQPSAIFDPGNPKVVGRFVSLALVAQDRTPLAEVPKFYGSGVYAIYYRGSFPLYAPLSGTETPIYVGQAAPTSNHARTPREQGPRLSSRLSTHRKNIGKAASTISLDDFDYRFLVVQSGWETAAEDYLIHLFHPIWNSETNILYGIGKHGDDAATRANKRSPWDTVHPGRTWAAGSTQDAKDMSQIQRELAAHFKAQPVYQSLEDIMSSFIDELRQV
jgi:hypothetical protein